MWKWANYVHAESLVLYRRRLKTGPKLGPPKRILSVTKKCGQFCGRKMAALLGSVSGSLLFRREDGDMRRPRLWSPSSLALFMRVV